MTRDEAISVGRSNASMALDAWRDYGGVQEAIDCCRDNVRDTLNEHRSAEHEDAAFWAFDEYICQYRDAAEAAAARELADIARAEAEAHMEEAAQERWAEAGGYASGLARPGSTTRSPKRTPLESYELHALRDRVKHARWQRDQLLIALGMGLDQTRLAAGLSKSEELRARNELRHADAAIHHNLWQNSISVMKQIEAAIEAAHA